MLPCKSTGKERKKESAHDGRKRQHKRKVEKHLLGECPFALFHFDKLKKTEREKLMSLVILKPLRRSKRKKEYMESSQPTLTAMHTGQEYLFTVLAPV
jgi:hypothetical protein